MLSGTALKTRWEIGQTWCALGISPGDPSSMQSFDAEGGEIPVNVDEGTGVTEEMFEAIEGIQTRPGARLLVVGNPTSIRGYFIKMVCNPTANRNTVGHPGMPTEGLHFQVLLRSTG